MRNLFLNPSAKIGKNKIVIAGEYYQYLKNVLRIKRGAKLTAVISSKLYDLCVEKIEKNRIICSIVGLVESREPFSISINVYQSLLKFKKMDLVVSKLSEMGIESFNPVICHRSVPRNIPGSPRLERWRRLTVEGGKSSGILKLMKIEPVSQYPEIIEKISNDEKAFILLFTPDFNCPHILDILNTYDLSAIGSVNLFFGPEGGFTPEEVERLKKIGGKVVNMGQITLRADTAAIIGTGLVKIILERAYKS